MDITLGRIVHYTLTSSDAEQINRRRQDAGDFPNPQSGAVVHTGNSSSPGDVVVLVVTRVWSAGTVNGQLLLDGNDTLWVTSRTEGEVGKGVGHWFWPPRS